jgi:hypothetical protein
MASLQQSSSRRCREHQRFSASSRLRARGARRQPRTLRPQLARPPRTTGRWTQLSAGRGSRGLTHTSELALPADELGRRSLQAPDDLPGGCVVDVPCRYSLPACARSPADAPDRLLTDDSPPLSAPFQTTHPSRQNASLRRRSSTPMSTRQGPSASRSSTRRSRGSRPSR